LRTFDQFSNIVLEDAVERRHFGKKCTDIPLGLFILRGDNIVLLGSVDDAREQAELEFVSADKMRE
jgi:U6 snRNA-associated Sm-like protein LSm1